ncbi:hypothetical protein HDF16_006336 [Granulicella aggregans]|uniref:Uncharacterized protein n=1 Tax=Granulicella aggregans TaxID=474949 RepID=A0A7W7ZKI4_9BACT|nr:hypothetical protein [Granulicella aggregans]
MTATGDPSSIFLGGFKVEWHTLSRWFANVEIKVRLFVAFRVLLPPQHQQKRRKLRKDNLRPVDFSVTSAQRAIIRCSTDLPGSR